MAVLRQFENAEEAKRYAERRHAKNLRRKDKKYKPSDWQRYQFVQKQKKALTIEGPTQFSILTNTDEVVQYLDRVRYMQQNQQFVRANLENVEYTDLPTISLLMAHMYDLRLPWGYLAVTFPSKGQPGKLFKKVKFRETIENKNSDSAHFLSRHDLAVNEDHKLSIINRVSKFYGGRKDTELNPILTEMLSNTNNHADRNETGVVPWLVTMEEDVENKSIRFCMVDLGIGIYESLTYKGDTMKRITAALDIVTRFFKNSQCETLSENIPHGLLSTTKLTYRGQGVKEIYDRVSSGPFTNFEILTNCARVDLLDIEELNEDSLYNFRGTLYFWTLKYE